MSFSWNSAAPWRRWGTGGLSTEGCRKPPFSCPMVDPVASDTALEGDCTAREDLGVLTRVPIGGKGGARLGSPVMGRLLVGWKNTQVDNKMSVGLAVDCEAG